MKMGYIVLNAKMEGANLSENTSTKLYLLGEDIKKLGLADVVLFCDEWKDDADCCVLHFVCKRYKKQIMTEKELATAEA